MVAVCVLYLLIYYLNSYSGQGWARSKPGTHNSILVSCVSGKGGQSSTAFGELDGKYGCQDSNWRSYVGS